MREFDDYGLKMCRFQAELFLQSKERMTCSSPIFLRRFMYLAVAKRMDREGFLFEMVIQEEVMQEIIFEFGESDYGKEKYSEEDYIQRGVALLREMRKSGS